MLVIGTFASQGYSLQMAATIDMFGAGPIEMNNRFYWNLQEAILVARWLCPFESVQAAGMNYLYKSGMGDSSKQMISEEHTSELQSLMLRV